MDISKDELEKFFEKTSKLISQDELKQLYRSVIKEGGIVEEILKNNTRKEFSYLMAEINFVDTYLENKGVKKWKLMEAVDIVLKSIGKLFNIPLLEIMSECLELSSCLHAKKPDPSTR